MSLALKVSIVLFKNTIFSQSSLFKNLKIETSTIKYTNITYITFYIITKKFTILLFKNIFSVAEIQRFFVSKKINTQNLLAIMSW